MWVLLRSVQLVNKPTDQLYSYYPQVAGIASSVRLTRNLTRICVSPSARICALLPLFHFTYCLRLKFIHAKEAFLSPIACFLCVISHQSKINGCRQFAAAEIADIHERVLHLFLKSKLSTIGVAVRT